MGVITAFIPAVDVRVKRESSSCRETGLALANTHMLATLRGLLLLYNVHDSKTTWRGPWTENSVLKDGL